MSSYTSTAEDLQVVVDRFVKGLQPDRIYLFGSRVRSQVGDDSDIDLLVVVPDSRIPRH